LKTLCTVPVHQGAGFPLSQAPVNVGFWSGSIVHSAGGRVRWSRGQRLGADRPVPAPAFDRDLIMALAMVVTCVAVTAFRAVRATEGTPWAERRAVVGRRPRHTHLHHHAY
jgi:hypothetical protein